MKVTKHGTVYPFECKQCGCQYLAGKNECTDIGFGIISLCPECGSEVGAPAIAVKEENVSKGGVTDESHTQ